MKAQKTRDVIKFLKSIGWRYLRDADGSHEIWGLPDESKKTSIPTGHREVSVGILRQIERTGVKVPGSWK